MCQSFPLTVAKSHHNETIEQGKFVVILCAGEWIDILLGPLDKHHESNFKDEVSKVNE